MKKLLLSFAAAALAMGASAAEVVETITVDCFGEFSGNAYKNVEWTSPATNIKYTGNMAHANEGNGGGMQFRMTSGKEAGLVSIANPDGYSIVSVKVVANTTASANTWQVFGNAEAYTNFMDLYNEDTTGSLIGSGTSESTVVATTTDFEFFGFRTQNKAIYIDSITITYATDGEAKEAAGLSFSEDACEVVLGSAFTAPEFTKATDATIAWTSSNEEVATVDADGVVTIIGLGTTTITATAEANDNYYGGSASYTLTVKDPNEIYANACISAACGFESVLLDGTNPWSIDGVYGLKASGYISGATNACDAIMASPVLDLTGRTDIEMSFEWVMNNFKLEGAMIDASQENVDKYCSIVAKAEGDTEWKTISNVELPEDYAFAWNPWNTNTVSLNDYAGKKMQVGFKYVSTAEIAGTWEIKNVTVTGKAASTVAAEIAESTDAPVYYNIQGVRVANPEKGLYIKVQGGKAVKVIL